MFQVGDVVRVRSWDDMKDEFGLDVYGDINCRFRFTRAMQKCAVNYIMFQKSNKTGWVREEREYILRNARCVQI